MVTAAPAAGTVPAERIPALSRRAGAVSALRRVWPWVAALLVALAVGAGIAFAWLDPRFDFLVDDGQNHADRVGLFDALLRRDGASLYPRWWPDLSLGYGYPLLTFYSPGVYYLAEAVHVLGASTYRALHLVAFGAVLLGTCGAFTLGAITFRSPLAALVLATVYAGAPYPFVTNLYNRSAFPEAMGLAVLPWLLVAGTLAVRRPGPLTALCLALCLAALVLVHSLSALIGAAVLALWVGATLLDTPREGRREGWRVAAGGVALGLALCAFFWVPAFFERGAVHTGLGSSGVLSFGPWLFDPLQPGPVETAITVAERYRLTAGPVDLNLVFPHAPRNVPGPVKPGLAQGLFLLLSLAAGVSGWLEWRRLRLATAPSTDPGESSLVGLPRARVALCLALCGVFWLLNTTWSRPLWEGLPLLAVLQFPWRFYGPLALALAFAGAGIFAWIAGRGQQQWILALLLAAFVVVNGRAGHTRDIRQRDPAALPSVTTRLQESEGESTASGTTSGGEFLPRSVVLPDLAPRGWSWKVAYEALYPPGGWIAGRVWPMAEGVEVRQVWDTPQWTAAQVEVKGAAPAEVAFRILVFPGWRAYVDGRPAPLRAAPYDPTVALGHGFAIVAVPPGVHDVRLALTPTLPEIAGTLLSIAAVGAAGVWLARGAGRRPLRSAAPALPVAIAGGAALIGAGYLLFALLPLWVAPGQPHPTNTALHLDLLGAVRAGQGVHVGAPDGNALGSFVDVREATIAGHHRRWLYMHPPAEVHVQLDVPPRAVFQAGLGVDPRGWEEREADGVRFVLEVAAPVTPDTRVILLDEVLQPQVRPQDRGWRFAEVSLAPYAGQRVTLILRTEGRDTPLFDWAGWATPAVYVDRSGRFPPPAAVPPALGFVPWAVSTGPPSGTR